MPMNKGHFTSRWRRPLSRRQALSRVAGIAGALALGPVAAPAVRAARRLRIFHVMSYHADWEWNREQFDAFREQLTDQDVEYRVFQMDTKRHAGATWPEEAGAKAQELIGSWQPDLVYANDDAAQQYVVQPYDGPPVPFVISGVNAAPASYGFDRRDDVTGVLEREHISQTLHLLRDVAPGVRRIAVLLDDGPTWGGIVERMRSEVAAMADVELVAVDEIETYAAYRSKVAAYQEEVDALGVLGVFTLKDEEGANVPFEEALRWTTEHSHLPDFSFWGSRVDLGTLCAVSVSGRAQGRIAGEMARAILVDGRSPGSLEFQATPMGQPAISLARARRLGLSVPSTILLQSHVVKSFAWDAA